MNRARVIAARIRGMFGRKRVDRELDDEVRFHLEMQVEHNLRSGMDPESARYAAMRAFGHIEPMKESYRERSAFTFFESTINDLRYASRVLRRSPGFTITSIAVLALGIGANTAMFSVVNAVLLRPLPFRSPDHLAMLWMSRRGENIQEGRAAFWNFEMWRRESRSFTDLALFDGVSLSLTGGEGAEQISVARVSSNFLSLLGVQPFKGRWFSAEEDEGRQAVAVISHRFWQTHFGGSREAIGATVELDGRPSRVIGILGAGFQVANLDADIWEPHTLFPDWETRRRVRGTDSWFVLGRLRAGVNFEQAQAEMSAIEQRLDEQLPAADRNLEVRVVPLTLQVTGARSRLAIWLLAGAVFCVLLIAATNVAGLWLARSAVREREIAVRSALGASHARIARQLLAESVMLALMAGLPGLLAAKALIAAVIALKPANLARINEVNIDPRVLGWALAICFFTAILVGLAPAMSMLRRKTGAGVSEPGRSIAGSVRARGMRRVLVITEFAVAVVLLVGGGLLIRSLIAVEKVDPGYNTAGILSMQVAGPPEGTRRQMADFYERVLERIQSMPGVENAGVIGEFFIGGNPQQILTAERVAGGPSEGLRVRRDEVSRGFFQTMGTRLVRGRSFGPTDGPESPRVAIVNETLARRLWRGEDPIGRRVNLGRDSEREWFTVVGVVGDMRRNGLEHEAIPQIFEPLEQSASRHAALLIKTTADDPAKMAATFQAAVHQVDKRAGVYHITTLEDRLAGFLMPRRFQTFLVAGFSAMALLIAGIGLFGLIQYGVTMRTREIGIRVAIGAERVEIFRMVVREGLEVCLIGAVLGLAGGWGLSRSASSLLFGISSGDPATFLVVAVLLTGAAATASYFPARRAMKVDPIVALRHE